MPDTFTITIAFIITIILVSLLVGFLIVLLLLNQKRQELLKRVYEQELLKSQLEIQESILKKISEEIHGNIGQRLYILKRYFYTIDSPMEVRQFATDLLTQAIEDIRALSKSLSLELIRDSGLTKAIESHVDELLRLGHYSVSFVITGSYNYLEEQKEILLFRILQEAINNIMRHSNASQIRVELDCQNRDIIRLTVTDDGQGFDPTLHIMQGKSVRAGGGISNMLGRTQLLGGQFNIESGPGIGTCISITVPSNNIKNDINFT